MGPAFQTVAIPLPRMPKSRQTPSAADDPVALPQRRGGVARS
ncbi:hypothetical protein HMPREF1503_0036 [Olsenella uli MSTE5]|nr:hypothetical protein HMPREF1503_0036 [Olsenella uli MSTE5]